MEEVIWKPIKNYPWFHISNKGELKNTKTGNILKQHSPNGAGYPVIATKIGGRNGKDVCFKIHRLIAEAFIPNPENKPHINHIDGNPKNNSIDNLEWCTHSENILHAHRIGLLKNKKGSESLNCVLSKDIIEQVRKEFIPYDREKSFRALAKKYNVNWRTLIAACSPTAKNKSYQDI